MIKQFPDPNSRFRWFQANIGDSSDSGNIWSSKNLDLTTNRGTMRLAGRLIAGESNLSEILISSVPISIISFQGDYYMIAGGRIFKTSGLDPDSGWSEDTGTGYQTDYDDFDSDLAVFDGKLWASNDNGWFTKTSAAGSWTNTTATPNAGQTVYFRRTDRLYIVQNSDNIESIDDAGAFVSSGDYTIGLTQATDNTISKVVANKDSIWIGANNNKDDLRRASIFRWDGISPQVDEIYRLNANKVYSMVIMDDIPYTFDNHGVLSQFTGSAFEEVGRIPMFNGSGDNDFPVGSQESWSGDMAMHFNGMTVTKDRTILCLIRNLREDSGNTIPENSPSGIWEWSPEFGFVHRYGFSYTPRDTTTITDWGQNRIGEPGALFYADAADNSSNRNGTILAGTELWLGDSTRGLFGVYYDDYRNFVQKKGYFVTTWTDSDQIQDKWERMWTVYRKFSDSSDSIVLKYRTDDEDAVETSITWTSTTTFTTTTDISAYANGVPPFNSEQGGEVEITRGLGSGLCAHITNVSEAGGTYTVTIDEVATGAGSVAPPAVVPTPVTAATASFGASVSGGYFGYQLEAAGAAFPNLSMSAFETSASATSVTKSVTVPAGSNQALIVRVSAYDPSGATSYFAMGVTYNGSALGVANGSGWDIATGKALSMQDWYIQAPAQTTADVVVTFAGATPNIVVQIFCYDGVDQTGNPLDFGDTDNTTNGGGTVTSLAITPAGTDYDLLLATAQIDSTTTITQSGTDSNLLFNDTVNSVSRFNTYEFGGITTYPGFSLDATARFQKWIKINPSQVQDTVQEFSQGAIGANSTSIQAKCCMTFTGTNQELSKLALVSNEDIKISP